MVLGTAKPAVVRGIASPAVQQQNRLGEGLDGDLKAGAAAPEGALGRWLEDR
jgi:hypothetical protein